MLPALKANALANNSTNDEFRDQWIRSMHLTEDLCVALHSNIGTPVEYYRSAEEKPRQFWTHQKYDFLRANDTTRGIDIEYGALLDVTARYLNCPEIRSNKFDWLLMDSIIFSVLDAYTDHIVNWGAGIGIDWAVIFSNKSHLKYFGLRLLFWPIRIALRYFLLPAFVYLLAIKGYETMAFVTLGSWGLYLLLHVLGFPIRWHVRKKANSQLTHLLELYAILGDNVISPRKLKEALDNASSEGIIFHGSVFGLVDRITAKDPTTFIPDFNEPTTFIPD